MDTKYNKYSIFYLTKMYIYKLDVAGLTRANIENLQKDMPKVIDGLDGVELGILDGDKMEIILANHDENGK